MWGKNRVQWKHWVLHIHFHILHLQFDPVYIFLFSEEYVFIWWRRKCQLWSLCWMSLYSAYQCVRLYVCELCESISLNVITVLGSIGWVCLFETTLSVVCYGDVGMLAWYANIVCFFVNLSLCNCIFFSLF